MASNTIVEKSGHERTIRYLRNEIEAIKNRMTSGGGEGGAGGGYEPSLGNPAADGYLLKSTAAGVRSWLDSATYSLAGHNHDGDYDPAGEAASEVAAHELTYDHDNYDTAYGWGDHAGLYAPIAGAHAAVTLAASAAVLLNLSTQEISLDNQNANLIFAGPATGAAAAPTFRAMVAADMGTTLSPTFAGLTLTGLVASATETTRIDATAANAFVDATTSLAAYAGTDAGSTPYYILLTDAAGKTAKAYLGAAGAGETTSEKLTDGGLENWASATNLTSWTESIAGTSTVNKELVDLRPGTAGSASCRMDIDGSNSAAFIYQSVTLVSSGLYRLTFWYKYSSAGLRAYWQLKNSTNEVNLAPNGTWSASVQSINLPSATTWTQFTVYFNAHASYTSYVLTLCRSAATSSSIYFDDVSLVQITDPDSTGLHVMSAYNGTDRGWASTEAGFDPITIASYKIYSNLTADFYNADDVSVFTVDEGGNLDSDGVYKVDGTQVVGPRVIDARASNTPNSGDADTDALIDAMRDALLQHGLLAAS